MKLRVKINVFNKKISLILLEYNQNNEENI